MSLGRSETTQPTGKMDEAALMDAVNIAIGDPKEWALRSAYNAVLYELRQLGEAWLEWKAAGKDTTQLTKAIDQATRESRKYERKLRQIEKRKARS